jgi:hypothetical protein
LKREGGTYNPIPLTDEARKELEGLKREFLKIEDVGLGDGAIASWGSENRSRH